MGPRSNSAIDPAAVRRASVRAQYAQRSRIIATQQNSPLVGLRKYMVAHVFVDMDLVDLNLTICTLHCLPKYARADGNCAEVAW